MFRRKAPDTNSLETLVAEARQRVYREGTEEVSDRDFLTMIISKTYEKNAKKIDTLLGPIRLVWAGLWFTGLALVADILVRVFGLAI